MIATVQGRVAALQAYMRRALHGVAIAGMTLMTVAILVVIVDVVLRHTVKISILGTVDITQLCVMAAAFWSIPYTFAVNGHVKVELLDSVIPRPLTKLLDVFAALLGLAFMAGMSYYGAKQGIQHFDYGDTSQTIGIPMVWYWGFLVSGGVLACFATATSLLERLVALFVAQERSSE